MSFLPISNDDHNRVTLRNFAHRICPPNRGDLATSQSSYTLAPHISSAKLITYPPLRIAQRGTGGALAQHPTSANLQRFLYSHLGGNSFICGCKPRWIATELKQRGTRALRLAVPILIRYLNSRRSSVRYAAVEILCRIGLAAKANIRSVPLVGPVATARVRSALLSVLNRGRRETASTRSLTLRGIELWRFKGRDVNRALTKSFIQSRNYNLRAKSISLFGWLNTNATRVNASTVRSLMKALRTDLYAQLSWTGPTRIFSKATRALSRIGPAAVRADKHVVDTLILAVLATRAWGLGETDSATLALGNVLHNAPNSPLVKRAIKTLLHVALSNLSYSKFAVYALARIGKSALPELIVIQANPTLRRDVLKMASSLIPKVLQGQTIHRLI